MTEPAGPSRRAIIRAGAWSVPALAAAVAAPAAAASGPDLTHVISVTGAMLITPPPATPDNFVLHYNDGPTTFDASSIFSTPAGDTACVNSLPCTENGWVLRWEATSTGTVPAIPAFITPHPTVSSITVENDAWVYESNVTITVTAISLTGYPSVSYSISFVVSD